MNIRKLTTSDAESYAALRREALLDAPLAFGASPGDDFVSDPAAVAEHIARGDDSVIFGAFDGGQIVGSLGIYRDRHRKAAHKAHIWGMYVRASQRGRGVGKDLVEAAIAHARTLPGIVSIHLSVSSSAVEAKRLYQTAGFIAWGTEPDALRNGGTSVDEDHMILVLGPTGADDRTAVIATTEAVFAAMRTKDESVMRASIRADASFVSVRVAEKKVLVRTGDEFVRGILANPATIDERIFDPKVDSDGRLASLRAAYDLHIDGRFSHRGTDVFVFLREDAGWVLISSGYTIE